jgi:hypothetical protein
MTRSRKNTVLATLCFIALLIFPGRVYSDEPKAGPGFGALMLNIFYLPVKATTVVWGVSSGALSYALSGGNAELTRQIWEDTTEGPYLITPEVVRASIGERPELERSNAATEIPPKTDSNR